MTNRALMVLRATWNWLWGKPIEAGGEIAAQVGADSIDDVAASVHKLTESVGLQQMAFNDAVMLLDETTAKVKQLGLQAEKMVEAGNDDAALELLAEQDVIDDYIPQLENQVKFAQQNLAEGKTRLREAQLELKKMQAQQRMGESTMRVTQALEEANRASGIDSQSAMRRFEKSQDAIQRRSAKAQAVSDVQGHLKGTSRAIQNLSAQERLAKLKAQKTMGQLEGDTRNDQ